MPEQHLFPVRSAARVGLQARLGLRGIEALINFPVRIPRHPAVASQDPACCPVEDRVCIAVFSLPRYPSLHSGTIGGIADALVSSS